MNVYFSIVIENYMFTESWMLNPSFKILSFNRLNELPERKTKSPGFGGCLLHDLWKDLLIYKTMIHLQENWFTYVRLVCWFYFIFWLFGHWKFAFFRYVPYSTTNITWSAELNYFVLLTLFPSTPVCVLLHPLVRPVSLFVSEAAFVGIGCNSPSDSLLSVILINCSIKDQSLSVHVIDHQCVMRSGIFLLESQDHLLSSSGLLLPSGSPHCPRVLTPRHLKHHSSLHSLCNLHKSSSTHYHLVDFSSPWVLQVFGLMCNNDLIWFNVVMEFPREREAASSVILPKMIIVTWFDSFRWWNEGFSSEELRESLWINLPW